MYLSKSSQSNGSKGASAKKRQEEPITGVILAGGKSRRMGRNKALLDLGGICLIEKTYQTMSHLFQEVILITNTPEDYAFLNCRCQGDIYPGIGSIAGLHPIGIRCRHTRHGRVPARRPGIPLPLDEHPTARRAPRHRRDQRSRSGRAPAEGGCR